MDVPHPPLRVDGDAQRDAIEFVLGEERLDLVQHVRAGRVVADARGSVAADLHRVQPVDQAVHRLRVAPLPAPPLLPRARPLAEGGPPCRGVRGHASSRSGWCSWPPRRLA